MRRRPVFATLLLGCYAVVPLSAQVEPGSEDWRQRPQPLLVKRADSVPRKIRSARDIHFDRIYGPPPKGWYSDGPDVGPILEEIPATKTATVALIRFADYKTVRSESRKSVYTEVEMNVEQVLQDPNQKLRPSQTLTVIIGGGSLLLPSGSILRRNLQGSDFCRLQPDHRYLAFLFYSDNRSDYYDCAKSWDLSSGRVEPTYPLDIHNAKNGTSHFAGMPEEQFITAVKEILSKPAR